MARLDLDGFVGDDHTLVFRGVEYAIPAEIPLEAILEAQQLVERVDRAKTRKEQVAVMERSYEYCMELLRERNPDVQNLRLSPSDVGRIIGFAASDPTGESLELNEAIAEALTGQNPEELAASAKKAGGRPPTRAKTKKPPRSGRRSPARSSS